ncbi:hypothetical protein M422DRAFT_33596 [Sphaerobolus stellatus SS14]|uniref:Unplaced genomic scaffold SPHSTscaffold_92, whole genome shotgun sequence n=1 Tax=Sphaerobolus stellatus (strain SS14) TaxID=990650 RepID=A0A0C9U425_SPHS4|nr:hypothetical protein M422DRAFT_33596 [Sphaerobolus stellatus SS14]
MTTNKPWRFGFAMGSRPAPKVPFNVVEKRGGGTTPNTMDRTTIPTAPPQSHFSHGVPKINGSTGGFIGLVVGLIVFIIICGIAIWYLLRRRSRRIPSTRSSGGGFRFFSSQRKRNAGWIQQTDAFNYDSDDEHDYTRPVAPARYAEGGQGFTGRIDEDGGYSDPFDPEKLPENVLRQQIPLHVHPSNPENQHGRTDMPRGYSAADITPKQSPTSPTFEGGTKFKEQF